MDVPGASALQFRELQSDLREDARAELPPIPEEGYRWTQTARAGARG